MPVECIQAGGFTAMKTIQVCYMYISMMTIMTAYLPFTSCVPCCGTRYQQTSAIPVPQALPDTDRYVNNDNGSRQLPNQNTDPHMTTNKIKIISWNIHGLNEEKLEQSLVGGFLKTFDIIIPSETWSTAGQSYGLEGFHYHDFCRRYKPKGGGWTRCLHKKIIEQGGRNNEQL